MHSEFSHVLAFFLLAILFIAGGLVTSWIVRPKHPNRFKNSSYECGEDPVGGAWVKFNIRYYVVALIFILFDVEIVFLFPWALVYKQMGWMAIGEMFTFMAILLVGFAYVWMKGDLDWVRPLPVVTRLEQIVRVQPVPATPDPALNQLH